MARFYRSFAHPNDINLVALMAAARTLDPTVSVIDRRELDGRLILGKASDWTVNQFNTAQGIINGATVVDSPQLRAQQMVDRYPIEVQALVLALLDQINVLRGKLVPPLPAITPAQAIQAIRDKAATL